METLCLSNVRYQVEDENGSPNGKEIPVSVSVSDQQNLNEALDSAKRAMIAAALERRNGNVSAAARLLGVSRDALRHHMKALGINR